MRDKDLISTLEIENRSLFEERDTLSTQLQQIDKQYKAMEEKYGGLQSQCEYSRT